MENSFSRSVLYATLFVCCSLFCTTGHAQTTPTSLPDSPDIVATLNEDPRGSSSSSQTSQLQTNSQASSTSDPLAVQQTKRILFIIPNFRAVSTFTQLPPQTVKEKFVTASQDSFDYSGIIFSGLLAAEAMATNQYPEFRQGAAGYGRYFWHTFVDQTSENYFVEFIVPAIAHEDTRYYTLGRGGFLKRAGYSLSRVVITRKDDGTRTFNAGEVIGAGAAAGISNLYYPSKERTFGNTAGKWGTNVGLDAGTFLFKEFWPDINRTVFHSKAR
ncbi:hypothetical protein [Edaphobacter bradus]|uniref:hypothetical protein n=1 Tax=Edaphobacter bradus TaxID=2259016 RepID=UPI0021DFBEFD|nr:hypothetical protein [Edaphobacter bradus]